jgi:site-specific DNA recombinase
VKTVIYARFSSLLQNARSIEDQVSLCRERCDREGWDVVGVFTDYATSGAAGIGSDARPGLAALLARVDAGGIDQVMTEASDRLARHQGDALTIREQITYAGARLFTLSDGEVSDITATFRGLMDAQFRKDLAAKIKRGQRGTIAQGRHAAGLAFGYRTANRFDDGGVLIRGLREIEPDQAVVVARIFTEFASGQSPRRIAIGLNVDGIAPPGRGKSASQHWRASTIYGDRIRKNGILQNRLYIGQIVFNRTKKKLDPKTRKPRIIANPEAEWLQSPAPGLRIIDDELWGRVQHTLGQVQARRPTDARRPKHLLSGLVRCGECDGAWIVRGIARWGCSRHRESGRTACANNRTISTVDLEVRVLRGLQDRLMDPGLVREYVKEFTAEFERLTLEHRKGAKDLRGKLDAAVDKVTRLVAAIAAGGSEFLEIRDALALAKAERDSLSGEISELEHPPVLMLNDAIVTSYHRKIANLRTVLNEEDSRKEAVPKLRALIDRVRVYPRGPGAKGVDIELTGKLSSIVALATDKRHTGVDCLIVGAGEGIRTLDPNLGKVVLYH